MKRLLITLLAVITGIVNAQDYTHDISLSVSATIPFGQFASIEQDDDEPGLAKIGVNYNLTYNYNLNENWSLKTSILYGINKIKEEVIANSYDSATVRATNWGTQSALIGGQLTLPNDNIDFFIAGQIGYALISSPSYLVEYDNSNFVDGEGSYSGNGIAFLTAVGIKIKPEEALGILLSLELFNVNAEFNEFSQSVSTINTKIGLSYSF